MFRRAKFLWNPAYQILFSQRWFWIWWVHSLHYTTWHVQGFFMYTIFNGVAYECRRLRFGLLLTVTATECLTRRSSVSPCEIILRLVLFVQIPKNKRKVPHRVQTGGQRPTLYSAPPPQAALPQVANLEEMIGGHSCSHNLSSDLSSFQQRMHLTTVSSKGQIVF